MAMEQLLLASNVYTNNGSVEKILHTIRVMQQQGRDKLIVLTDFDMTLTRYYVNGDRGKTSFGVIESSSIMPEQYRKDVAVLRAKYAPKEVDPTLSKEEWTKCVQEWYSQAHELLVEFKVKKSDLKEIVSSGNIKLRAGCESLFSLLHSNAVPLVIVSAGIADTLILAIEEQLAMRDNISIISNFFQFDEVGMVTGFSETMITSSNKGNLSDQFSTFSSQLKGRSNVLLIGDSLGDPLMANGMETRPDHMIKIGFLNHDVDKLLKTYLELYDIVLTGDGDMSLINQMLEFILHSPSESS